jgi:hypothetical protein
MYTPQRRPNTFDCRQIKKREIVMLWSRCVRVPGRAPCAVRMTTKTEHMAIVTAMWRQSASQKFVYSVQDASRACVCAQITPTEDVKRAARTHNITALLRQR